MSGDKLLLDTNIVIDYLKGIDAVVSFIDERPTAELFVSVITRMELLSFGGMQPAEAEAIHGFLDAVNVIPLNDEVEQFAISVRRSTRRKMPDAIVAATALWLYATLITADGQLAKTNFPDLRVVLVGAPPDPQG